jgi:hypothetical protein
VAFVFGIGYKFGNRFTVARQQEMVRFIEPKLVVANAHITHDEIEHAQQTNVFGLGFHHL